MSKAILSWRNFVAVGALSLLGACADAPPPHHTVASNPPPIAPGANASWSSVNFDNNSFAIDQRGQNVIKDVTLFLQHNPKAVATIIGKTDTVGGADYNMHLSHQRADAVRDAIVYGGHIAADRVETRWTGERRPDLPTGADVASATNRVVDIAIH
jgi:outer membrane protein OmpA-like peptidoglycan-associated protein